MDISVRTNVKAFQAKINAVANKQIPFAVATALNDTAAHVSNAEKKNEVDRLDRPRPFTQNALRVLKARKDRLYAQVVMMDITARYLEPYEFGGLNVLNSRALLKPIDAKKDLDQYGNLPRTFMSRMRGRSDVFVGTVQTKIGPVSGVWQRTVEEGTKTIPIARVGKDGKLKLGRTRKGINTSGKLKLLVKFTDAHVARQNLDWFGVAQRVISRSFDRRMKVAMAKALSTAKP
jgi:hypothetical protein